MNLFFLAIIFFVPLIIFSVKPEGKSWILIGRIIFLLIFGHILANFMIQYHHKVEMEEHRACQMKFPDPDWQLYEECGQPWSGDGAQTVFYMLFGWLFVSGYIGFWELIWRIKHYERIKKLGKNFKAKWFSNLFLIFFSPVIFYSFLMFLLFIYYKLK